MVYRRITRRKRRRRAPEDEESIRTRPTKIDGDRFGLRGLQQQIGNQAVQQMLVQQQGGAKDEAAAKEPAETGEIKIKQPEIEYYEVDGNSLPEVSDQVLPPGQWYQYEYQYKPKVEQGQVIRVDIEIKITLQLPRWVGQGWEQATEADKVGWLQLLQSIEGKQEESQEVTQLSKQWLLGPQWEKAPDEIKKAWRDYLREFQAQEKSYLDIARRRAMVLQQRLFNQPEDKVKAIFDQFIKDLKIEQEIYDRQLQLGQEQKVSLGAETIVQ